MIDNSRGEMILITISNQIFWGTKNISKIWLIGVNHWFLEFSEDIRVKNSFIKTFNGEKMMVGDQIYLNLINVNTLRNIDHTKKGEFFVILKWIMILKIFHKRIVWGHGARNSLWRSFSRLLNFKRTRSITPEKVNFWTLRMGSQDSWEW